VDVGVVGDGDLDDDGLSDDDEATWGTDPTDGDTDDDGLSDGEEVHTYETDPNDADTDDGGVSDGDEVLDDGTDPLDGTDDRAGIEDTDAGPPAQQVGAYYGGACKGCDGGGTVPAWSLVLGALGLIRRRDGASRPAGPAPR
jgi:hypothetical protein